MAMLKKHSMIGERHLEMLGKGCLKILEWIHHSMCSKQRKIMLLCGISILKRQ